MAPEEKVKLSIFFVNLFCDSSVQVILLPMTRLGRAEDIVLQEDPTNKRYCGDVIHVIVEQSYDTFKVLHWPR